MMKSLWMRSAVAAGAMIAVALPQAAMAREASDYVKCDGKARDVSIGEGLARLTVIIGTMGLAGSPETDNIKERLYGEPGIAACNAAMADGQVAAPGVRRAQLLLGHAIHNIEAGQFQSALDDLKGFYAAAGPKADEHGFKRSVGLSAIEIEAMALVHMGRLAEAEAAALRMAKAEPFDIINQSRARPFMMLAADLGAEKRSYYRDFARLMPGEAMGLAQAEIVAGDFANAAKRYEAANARSGGDKTVPSFKAEAALVELLAGNIERSDDFAAKAREQADNWATTTAADDALSNMKRELVSRTDELLDFLAIARLARDGKIDDARAKFGGRARWLAPPVAIVARLARQLRQGAAPKDLTGALARDPEEMLRDMFAVRAKALTSPDADKLLFNAMRPALTDGSFSGFASNVWKTDNSKWLKTKTDADPGQIIEVTAYSMANIGVPASEALLMHAALLAQARGKTAILVLHPRDRTNIARVDFVDAPAAGEDGFAIPVSEIVAAFSSDFPKPAPTK